MREERERQRAADLERIKQQQQREEEAARRAEERRRQPSAATTAAAQDGVWRRSGASAPAPVRTPPRSESPVLSGPPRPLFSRGGAPATSAWRKREQAKNTSAATGSPAPSSGTPEEPRRAENREDGSQAAKNVWKPSRLRG
jgi:hypothetical protein